jgi:hypothetical protein
VVGVVTAGGSLALAELIDGHGAALVGDFQAHYGLRLADIVYVWPPREVLALVEGLPDDGLLAAHQQGGDEHWREFLGWGSERHMFANLYDLTVRAAGEKKFSHPRPAVKKPDEGVPLMNLFRSKKT